MMRFALVLITSLPGAALAGPAATWFDAPGTVDLSGPIEVPLLRGIDTKARPAVFASGGKGDGSDEFLLLINTVGGSNKCTEPVAKALGGTIEEVTLSRTGSVFKKVTKVTTKLAQIPKLHIGGLVIRDWRCQIHAEENSLAAPLNPELGVALLPSRGVVKFAPASEIEALLTSVGTPIQGARVDGGTTWKHGTKVTQLGSLLQVPVTLFGQPASALLAADQPSVVEAGFAGVTTTTPRSGARFTFGGGMAGSTPLPAATFVVTDNELAFPAELDAILGHDVLYGLDVAIDPANHRVALAPAATVSWQNPGTRILEEKKKAFEAGSETTALLAPAEPSSWMVAEAAPSAADCEPVTVVDQPAYGQVAGIRTFGARVREVTVLECPEPQVEGSLSSRRRSADDEAPTDAGGALPPTATDDGTDAPGSVAAGKEATRQADWGDALWSQGRYDEAYAAFTAALADAGDDCSFYVDHAEKSLRMGQLDAAATSAARAAELYESYMALSLESRLRTEQKKYLPGDARLVQAHDCHKARGIEAQAALARGEHARVDALFDAYMDLDEDLAMTAALARLQRGWAEPAQGLLLRAINVGGRGNPTVYGTMALVGARVHNDRLLQANLDRVFELEGPWGLADGLTILAAAREAGGATASLDVAKRLTVEHPTSAVSWALYGLEARRSGDAAALEAVRAKAAEVAKHEVYREAGLASATCRAASLLAVAGDEAGSASLWSQAAQAPGRGLDCPASRMLAASLTGDTNRVMEAQRDLATRFPAHPLGTLGLTTIAPPSR